MDRIIEVKGNGGYLTTDKRKAGNQHEANSTKLRITLDPIWDGYAKTVTFWDAKGQHPVKRTLTVDLLENADSNTHVYLCPIPGEALAENGMMTFTIDGYVNGVRQRTVGAELEVTKSPYDETAGEPIDPTPSQAEQLQVQIDRLIGGIQSASKAEQNAAKSAAEAEGSATSAAISAVGAAISEANAMAAANMAEGYTNHPPVVNDETGYWQEWNGERYVDTEHYSVGPQGDKGERGDRGVQGVQGIQGSAGIQGPQGDVGPRGPQGVQGPAGPRGISGVVVETAGYVSFSVTEDGDLQCAYTGDEAPQYSITEDGYLTLTV